MCETLLPQWWRTVTRPNKRLCLLWSDLNSPLGDMLVKRITVITSPKVVTTMNESTPIPPVMTDT